MTLKPTIIGFFAIYPLSPWERARERANRNNLRKRRLKKMATKKYTLPKPPKEKHKNNCCQIRFRRPLPAKTDTLRLKSDFPDTLN